MTQQPPAKRRLGCGIAIGAVGIVVLIIIIGAAGSSGPTRSTPQAPSVGGTDNSTQNTTSGSDPAADIALSNCAVTSEFGFSSTKATIKITNHTDSTQSYLVTVSVNDSSGSRVGEINEVSNSLAPGQSVSLNGTGTATTGFKAPLTCVVASVNRTPG